MKKTLLFGALMLATVIAQATETTGKSYQCTQTNTRPWGAADVDEAKPERIGNVEVIRLSCTNPGDKVCQFSDGHCPARISQSTVDASVRGEIASGILSGIQTFPGGHYSWNATSVEDFSYEIIED